MMRTRFRLFLTSAILMILCSLPFTAQSTRRWSKRFDRFVVNDVVQATWTCIRTTDGLEPQIDRWLYKDSSGNLLVIRDSDGTMSIEHVATREFLSLTVGRFDPNTPLRTDVTIRLGGDSIVTDMAELTRRPLRAHLKARGATMASKASPALQHTLRRLAELGCSGVPLATYFPSIVFAYSHLFYDDLRCSHAPRGSIESSPQVVDAESMPPPDEYERQFGEAYFE